MQLTGKAKALLGAAVVGTGITGTTFVVGSKKDDVVITLVGIPNNNLFIFEKGENWSCYIVGIIEEENLDSNIFINNLTDSFSNYWEDYENTKRIKKDYVDGFMKSCSFLNSSKDQNESENYEIVLNLQQINGEWNFDKSDLKKVFEGNWVSFPERYGQNM